MEFRVVGTSFISATGVIPRDGVTHRHIVEVDVSPAYFGQSRLNVATVIEQLQSRNGHRFYTQSPTTLRRSEITLGRCDWCGHPHIRTVPDGVWDNNLEALPSVRYEPPGRTSSAQTMPNVTRPPIGHSFLPPLPLTTSTLERSEVPARLQRPEPWTGRERQRSGLPPLPASDARPLTTEWHLNDLPPYSPGLPPLPAYPSAPASKRRH